MSDQVIDPPIAEPEPVATAAPSAVTAAELAAAVASARAEAEASFVERVGFSPDEAALFIAEKTAADEAALSEIEREKKRAAELVASAERREAAALSTLHTSNVMSALVSAGVAGPNVEDIARMVTAPVGCERSIVDAEVEALKAKMPTLFTVGVPASSVVDGAATASRQASGSGTVGSAKARAQERYQKKFA